MVSDKLNAVYCRNKFFSSEFVHAHKKEEIILMHFFKTLPSFFFKKIS
ncbi:hypothetical protein BCBMB205_39870 [Bacillus sp. CN2]|nr:hypothetical protein BCBMB205_39870 [Bacillus velezensis]ARZ60333.1 hypothetical protein BAGQ_4133 [Bacillus velezensis]GFR55411.1 hypothetical protein BCBMB205_39870 [Bacillus sp. CN2]